MPPKKNKGKGKAKEGSSSSKGKGKAKESSSGSNKEQERSTHVFDIILDELNLSYQETMEAIPRALRELLLAKAPKRKNGKTRLRRVHKRLYTIYEGTFQIKIMPSRNSPREEHLRLLFRWRDLYYIGYHCNDTWYLFEDMEKMDPPPPSQLFYRNRKQGGVVDLPFSTSYDSLGGYSIFVGPQSFQNLYNALMQTAMLKQQGNLNDLFNKCQMSLPAVVFSEALRFSLFLQWVCTQTSLEVYSIGDSRVPSEYHTHFTSWGSDSTQMFDTRDVAPPQDIAGRLAILKTPFETVTVPIIRGPHDLAASESSEDEG